jgi:hypothetical protein
VHAAGVPDGAPGLYPSAPHSLQVSTEGVAFVAVPAVQPKNVAGTHVAGVVALSRFPFWQAVAVNTAAPVPVAGHLKLASKVQATVHA